MDKIYGEKLFCIKLATLYLIFIFSSKNEGRQQLNKNKNLFSVGTIAKTVIKYRALYIGIIWTGFYCVTGIVSLYTFAQISSIYRYKPV